ncbi:hypothetical protein ABPG72_012313 [Tetrahymena utriculariae]
MENKQWCFFLCSQLHFYFQLTWYPQYDLQSFPCINIKYDSFGKDFLQYLYDSTYSLWKYLLMIPLILLWALFIPAGQYYVLRRASKTPKDNLPQPVVGRPPVTQEETMLDSSKIRYALGFIYLEYRKETYYWEIIKIFEKMLLVFILNMCGSEIKSKCILCFVIIFGYGLISLHFRTYQREQLNSVDFWSQNFYALSIVFGFMLSSADSNQIIQQLGNSFIILINLVFILWIVKIILSAYLEQYDEIENKVKIFLCKICPSLKPILKPKEDIYKKTKLLWYNFKSAFYELYRSKRDERNRLELERRNRQILFQNVFLDQRT